MRTADRRRVKAQQHGWFREALARQRALTCVHRVADRNLEIGAVLWAHVPFEDIDGSKLRPVVVVDRVRNGVVVHPFTTSLRRLARRDHVEIDDLDTAGLDRPCGVNVARLVELARGEVVSRVGALSVGDFVRVQVTSALLPFVG